MSSTGHPVAPSPRHVALVYARKSVVRSKADEISPERQVTLCVAEAERRGWAYEIFKDAEGHRSGGSEKHRPEWRRLKLQLARPDVAAVIVADISRAGRNRKDLYGFLDEIERRAIDLVDLRYKLDTTTAAGRLMLGMLINVLAWEREVDSERALEAINFKRSRGKHVGNAPFGTKRDDHGLLVPGADWPTCQRVLELYASGNHSLYGLPYRLNGEGLRFRDRAGAPVPFDRYSVRSIVSNVLTYAGYIVVRHAKDMSLPRVLDERDPIASLAAHVGAIRGQHMPLISDELAAAVIRIRHRSMRPHGDVAHRIFILAPVARCAECGGQLRGVTAAGVSRYVHRDRACVPRKGVWPADVVERKVLDELRTLKLTPADREELRRRIEHKLREIPERAQVLVTIGNLEAKLERLKALYIEGDIQRAHYDSQKLATLREIAEQRAKLGGAVQDLDAVLAQLDNLADILARGSARERRRALADLFREIHLDFSGRVARMIPRAWVSAVCVQATPTRIRSIEGT